jgi:hypothetical protein
MFQATSAHHQEGTIKINTLKKVRQVGWKSTTA